MTISRQRFYKWLHSYAVYKTGQAPLEGRDMTGRWIELIPKKEEKQEEDLF